MTRHHSSRPFQIFLPLATAFILVSCATPQQRHANEIALIANTGSEERQSETLTSVLAKAEQALATGLHQPEQRSIYNQAVEDAVTLWIKHSNQDQHTQKLTVQDGTRNYQLQVSWHKKLRFDRLIPSQFIENKALRQDITREGAGAAFVAQWESTPERQKTEPFMSSKGYFASVTATLDFKRSSTGKRTASLVLHNPNTTEHVQLRQKNYTLKFNQSALAEYILSLDSDFSALGALLRPSKYLDQIALHSISPPDPTRIPIIFTHGLASEPRTWQNVYNELRSDPVIRKRCQVYFFRYPSGVPVLYSAAILREKMDTLYKKLNAHGDNRRANQMMLVGHSMGGLITKSQIQNSGNKLWLSFVDDNKNYAHLSNAQLATFQKYLVFKPNPHISRVVFIATPHRGSELADYWIVRLLRKLIQAPVTIIRAPLAALDQSTSDSTADEATKKLFKSGVPTSMENLSPESNYVKQTVNLPLGKKVKVHSIVGNLKGWDLSDPECTDGVVPYSSAHINQIKSEVVVPYGHSAHEHPMAIEEVRRIIRLHVKKNP